MDSAPPYKFRELYGRAFNSQSDNYMLPADDVEHTRLDIQHDLLKLHLRGLYPAVDLVRAALSPQHSPCPAVLDIGTGSGRWVLEMAMEFPHAEVVGLDLAPPTLKGINNIPANCRFEVDNVNLPLDHYESTFDLVHVRGVELGITDYNVLLYNIARTLKPGALLILIGGYPQLVDENFEPLPVALEGQPRFTWIQRVFGEVYSALLARADNAVDSKQFWKKWLADNPNYEDAVFKDEYIPMCPWEKGLDERQTYVAELMRYNFSTILYSYKPLLLLDGTPSDVADQMIENAIRELRELKARGYVRWTYVWVHRTLAPWVEKLETPEFLEPVPSVYYTEEYKQEKARVAAQRSASVVGQL
ncbi:hypothetical protein FRC02_010200 [Tulasnella sp. 418]|nr:hypothetical protein FRC02_010200 [Tulasnella sp. 418]